MQQNEVQFWRIINACHSAPVPIDAPTGVKWVQTAQDGVQLDPRNYNLAVQAAQKTPGTWTNAALTTPMTSAPWIGNLAAGNRVDMLVQAPARAGSFPVTFGGKLLFTINVTGNAVATPITFPPALSDFPSMPGFLKDINPADVVVRRELHFRSTPGPGRAAGTNIPPTHTINGKRFEDHIIDQSMLLGATEEWTLYNDNVGIVQGAAHPFHIHVNPFQVTEILNPAVSNTPMKLPTPWVWWDDIAIPPGGYIKFLSRFVDFTGAYVLHCHILGHEDRGMMQLVQVISNTTSLGHK
jgi:FtsP/CotA-like multicopper oxidase with cupredoxin domain